MDITEDSGSKQASEFINKWEREQHAMSIGGVTNGKLYKEIIVCQNQGVISELLGEMFMSISKRMVDRMNLPEEHKDDSISNGAVQACNYYQKFDPSKTTNALAYIIQVIKQGHVQYIHAEQRARGRIYSI